MRLGARADERIPALDGMPSATDAGATGEHLDRVLRARPDLASQLGGALSNDAPPTDQLVVAVRYAVTAAYYLAPAVVELPASLPPMESEGHLTAT
jgi:hypothetical protein